LTSGTNDVLQCLVKHLGIRQRQVLVGGIEVGTLVIRELGQQVGSRAGYLDLDMRRSGVACDTPIVSEVEPRVCDPSNYRRDFYPESSRAVSPIEHLIERQTVQPLLEEIIHVLATTLAIGDDIKACIRLVARCPANDFVSFLPGKGWLL